MLCVEADIFSTVEMSDRIMAVWKLCCCYIERKNVKSLGMCILKGLDWVGILQQLELHSHSLDILNCHSSGSNDYCVSTRNQASCNVRQQNSLVRNRHISITNCLLMYLVDMQYSIYNHGTLGSVLNAGDTFCSISVSYCGISIEVCLFLVFSSLNDVADRPCGERCKHFASLSMGLKY